MEEMVSYSVLYTDEKMLLIYELYLILVCNLVTIIKEVIVNS